MKKLLQISALILVLFTLACAFSACGEETPVYEVNFVDYDGEVLKTEKVEQGKSATAPADPVRDNYTFAGWDVAFDKVTEDITVTATYTENGKFTVTFVDYDGSVLATEQVYDGKGATAPADPIRENYTFAGWDIAFDNITAATTVTATYTENEKFTVTFKDYDNSSGFGHHVIYRTDLFTAEAPKIINDTSNVTNRQSVSYAFFPLTITADERTLTVVSAFFGKDIYTQGGYKFDKFYADLETELAKADLNIVAMHTAAALSATPNEMNGNYFGIEGRLNENLDIKNQTGVFNSAGTINSGTTWEFYNYLAVYNKAGVDVDATSSLLAMTDNATDYPPIKDYNPSANQWGSRCFHTVANTTTISISPVASAE